MDIVLSNTSDKPIYRQIADQMIDQVMNEKITAGELLPSIRILAKELKVSVITTKRVYEELEKEGYIETVVGKGTYVSGINKDLMKERKVEILEQKMTDLIDNAKRIQLTRDEVSKILDLLWEEA
ncbi:MAG: GntR family transcriptional regulator [Clostridia bacterium]|nr:GntR family transcriptional regulator [Clostridia bacterium]